MNQLAMLVRTLQSQEACYNPEMRAVAQPFSSPGYHTTLTAEAGNVHSTRTAAYYALALLDSGIAKYRERAYAVLVRLAEAQDTNPENKTYGIWSWFYEEPLSQMSPPDWNWADFIGKPLLLALKRHGDTLPAELKRKMEQAVSHACQAIIRRNVGPSYTNIAIMGAFVTLIAGEWLGDDDVREYGLARLQRFYDYTMECGTFQEFNSPTYTSIAIEELSSIRNETRDELAQALAEQLLDIAWTMVAERFHPASGQWGGPHARAYSELLTPSVKSFLQIALDGRVSWLADDEIEYHTMWYGNDFRCPDRFVDCFTTPRTAGSTQPLLADHTGAARNAVSWMTEAYSLGTMSRSELWNQRRSLIAYAATPQGPAYVRFRALRDGYDYTGALLLSAQREGHALFGVHFATDGGDRHPHLDPIRDGAITASDLRLRFEFGGAIDDVEAEWSREGDALPHCATRLGAAPLHIGLTAAMFSDEEIRFEAKREGGCLQLDVVLYAGAMKAIRLPELGRAVVAGQFAIGAEPLAAETELGETICSVRAFDQTIQDGTPALRIDIPVRPAPLRELSSAGRAEVEGMAR